MFYLWLAINLSVTCFSVLFALHVWARKEYWKEKAISIAQECGMSVSMLDAPPHEALLFTNEPIPAEKKREIYAAWNKLWGGKTEESEDLFKSECNHLTDDLQGQKQPCPVCDHTEVLICDFTPPDDAPVSFGEFKRIVDERKYGRIEDLADGG